MPLILFFYGLFARQYVVFDVCIFKKQKRLLHLCIVGAFVRFIWLDLSVWCHFQTRVFLAVLLVTMTHLETLPSTMKCQEYIEYYTRSLSDNYKWTWLGQLIICKLLLESPRNFVTRLMNFLKVDDITSTDRFKGFYLLLFLFFLGFLIPEMQETLIKTNLDLMFNIIWGCKLYTED